MVKLGVEAVLGRVKTDALAGACHASKRDGSIRGWVLQIEMRRKETADDEASTGTTAVQRKKVILPVE
jgi:hypothetical protein